MPIPGPGPAISIQTIVDEFGGTAPHSLTEYYRGGGLVQNVPQNAAIPTSGTIAMSNFYGASSRNVVNLVISGNTYNYDVFANRSPSYIAGNTDLTVTINPGVVVGSTSTGGYAMLVPSSFNPGDTVTIVNNGLIQGTGGAGGGGSSLTAGGSVTLYPAGDGAPGGNAIFVDRPTIITNNSVVAGGGGGGGGGASVSGGPAKTGGRTAGSGGGGGAGFDGGAGGAGGVNNNTPRQVPGNAGSPGTSPAGGAGGPANTGPGGTAGEGGPGGGRGAAGATGGAGGPPTKSPIGVGGAAGNYIVGNPFVTWPVTGTRQGGVA
jgi:hypothetical protein